MRCGVFACSIFLFFFISSLVNVARAESVKSPLHYHHNGIVKVSDAKIQPEYNPTDGPGGAGPDLKNDYPNGSGPTDLDGPQGAGPGNGPHLSWLISWVAVKVFLKVMFHWPMP